MPEIRNEVSSIAHGSAVGKETACALIIASTLSESQDFARGRTIATEKLVSLCQAKTVERASLMSRQSEIKHEFHTKQLQR